jgi:hypothetical protein
MQKVDKWSEQMSFYRFFNNERVTEKALIGCMEDHCLKHCAGLKEAVLIEDTSEINLERHRNRITDREGLGPVGNGKDLGFFCHPTIVTDPKNRAVIGAIDLHIWVREEGKERKAEKEKRHSERKPLEEKESCRWAERAVVARERLSGVPVVTVVQDREGDIYESYAILKEHDVNWVIRANHDRKIRVEEGSPGAERESIGVREYLEGKEAEGGYEIEVKRKGEKNRMSRPGLKLSHGERKSGRIGTIQRGVQAAAGGGCGKREV